MTNLLNIPSSEILTNSRKKYIFLNGEKTLVEILAFDTKKFNPTKAEIQRDEITKNRKSKVLDSSASLDRSIRRAKKNIYDYMLCNPSLDGFVTLTMDSVKIDRYDYKAIIKKLNTWLDNLVRRKGLKYILIPELHKDGAIHFHGFVNSTALDVSDSGHKNGNKIVYNISNYRLGFSTLIKIGDDYLDRVKVSGYIGKYITKQQSNGCIGGRFYLHGGALELPEYEYTNMTFDDFDGDVFSPYPNATAKLWRLKL